MKRDRARFGTGMVVAAQPEAVEAGVDALESGGNAVDAAIACALVAGVVDPQMCGIAGFGSAQLFLPNQDVHIGVDFHGTSPGAVRPNMWEHLIEGEARDGFGFILRDNVNDLGYQSITTPGSLLAYHEAQTRYGRLPWADIVSPAIRWAEQGFVVRPGVYHWWCEGAAMGRVDVVKRLAFSEAGRRIYFDDDGGLHQIGSTLRNPDLANTLRLIARDGAEVFYRGEIADQISADMTANGGLLSAADLAGYRTVWGEPIRTGYRGLEVATNQPPGGGVMVAEMLNILQHFDLVGLGHNSVDYIRTVSEAMKLATADKDDHVGDPAFVDVPIERLLSPGYGAELATHIRTGGRTQVSRMQGEPPDTTHVCVVDGEGNAVTMTHSLGMPSGVITDGLGFMYNGCMGVFDPQVLLNHFDFGMPILDAVIAPRFSSTSNAIDLSNRIPHTISRRLQDDGYEVVRWPQSYAFAMVHAIAVKPEGLSGAADPAGDGMALAPSST